MKTLQKFLSLTLAIVILSFVEIADISACTGITLKSNDGAKVLARTVEWANTPMRCGYVVVPQGYIHQSLTPEGKNGMKYKDECIRKTQLGTNGYPIIVLNKNWVLMFLV